MKDYFAKFVDSSRLASAAEIWDNKTINKNFAVMKKAVQKIYALNQQKEFFDAAFSSEERCVRRWAACFSEIFNYDLQKSYEIFLEESKQKHGRPTDIISGAKIAADRLAEKLQNLNK